MLVWYGLLLWYGLLRLTNRESQDTGEQVEAVALMRGVAAEVAEQTVTTSTSDKIKD